MPLSVLFADWERTAHQVVVSVFGVPGGEVVDSEVGIGEVKRVCLEGSAVLGLQLMGLPLLVAKGDGLGVEQTTVSVRVYPWIGARLEAIAICA